MRDTACLVKHMDKDGNTIPCPGYPHAMPAKPSPERLEQLQQIAGEQGTPSHTTTESTDAHQAPAYKSIRARINKHTTA